ncbi:hypothetical protein FOPG_19642 [Fusarium oxysporum f. sp. conglutinans race 2 54008]|uniref:Uncharacterized protein n=1 Tax=Fusarium oxysporum f. sp. conglutinans race 2 54008 TaxID=1089457 RepID=X0GKB4_FUSOX|nr:hypothetical protein FOPG_19642 [Fusarium oxysporum f. sp. conglutinans race 2 54008]
MEDTDIARPYLLMRCLPLAAAFPPILLLGLILKTHSRQATTSLKRRSGSLTKRQITTL